MPTSYFFLNDSTYLLWSNKHYWYETVFVNNRITCKGSNSPLNVVSIVALNATPMVAKEKWRSGDEEDASDGKNSEDTVPDCTSLLQEDPGQQGGKDWITEREREYERERD